MSLEKDVVASAPPRERRMILPDDWHVLMSVARDGQERRPEAPAEDIFADALPQAEPRLRVG